MPEPSAATANNRAGRYRSVASATSPARRVRLRRRSSRTPPRQVLARRRAAAGRRSAAGAAPCSGRRPRSRGRSRTRDPNSPLGVWLTEEKEGKVRIEQCGANLCGYSVDAKSNQNGEQVLINMKPGKDLKWSGRILDPNTGSTYDSTIALKGTDTLRVQGCAFGGMFCGGQTWTRVN